MPAQELIFDEGVLSPEPICEFQGWRATAHCGGLAVLPWRADWLDAERHEVRVAAADAELGTERFSQCLVHLQKSRAATWQDLAHAWKRLKPGGRLLLCGGNELGVVSAVKRLARELEQTPLILTNRRRARITAFERSESPGPLAPDPGEILIEQTPADSVRLRTDPGVFSARRLDQGSQLLLEGLADCRAPRRLLDLGCGVGPLGLSGLLRWPSTRALLLDADARAVASATHNATTLGLADRCEVAWWDAEEPVPGTDFDLILLNPPFHGGKEVDLRPAHAMFQAVGHAMAADGLALIVANRSLPYERPLSDLGPVETLRTTRSYKLLAVGARRHKRTGRRAPRPQRD